MAPVPERIGVRMYQVGFGDCFLVSLHYPRKLADGRRQRHLLIDFGSSQAPKGLSRTGLGEVAERIAADCEGKLDVLVVTHRHDDHISGFADDEAAATIEALGPDLIVRPWTDAPSAAVVAGGDVGKRSRQLLAGLGQGEEFAGALAEAIDGGARGLRGDVRKLASLQLANGAAMRRLARWAGESDAEYLHAGMASRIGSVVPGLEVDVLGPPTADQFEGLVDGHARDPEHWRLYKGIVTAIVPTGALGLGDEDDDERPREGPVGAGAAGGAAAAGGAGAAAAGTGGGDGGEALAEGIARLQGSIPAGPARWLAERLARHQVHSLQRVVRSFDDVVNNTSLMLLFRVGDRHLLFPGDGLIESWRFTLEGLSPRSALARRLSAVDLYKVGHHGSGYATPRSLFGMWDGANRPVSLLSTRPGAHGRTDATAVPRATLVAALRERTELYSTEDLDRGQSVLVEADVRGAGRFELTEPGS